jgi:hypothetical protein
MYNETGKVSRDEAARTHAGVRQTNKQTNKQTRVAHTSNNEGQGGESGTDKMKFVLVQHFCFFFTVFRFVSLRLLDQSIRVSPPFFFIG